MAPSPLSGTKAFWKRYLINNSRFLFSIGMQFLGIRRYSTELSDTIAAPEIQTGDLGQGSATLDVFQLQTIQPDRSRRKIRQLCVGNRPHTAHQLCYR